MLTAKMSGIMPAELTRNGIVVACPPYCCCPRTRRAYCTGIFRTPSLMRMMPTIVSSPMPAKRMIETRLNDEPPVSRFASPPGNPATMPPKMMMLTPLPMPFSVINSPIQTSTSVAATVEVSSVKLGRKVCMFKMPN